MEAVLRPLRSEPQSVGVGWQRGTADDRALAYAEVVSTAHAHSVPAFLHPAYSMGPAPGS
jgi:hypothetical protein